MMPNERRAGGGASGRGRGVDGVEAGGRPERDTVKSPDIRQSRGENVIGLYQQGVNILAQGGFAVAKQQEQRNQSRFCCSKEEKKSRRRRRRRGCALVVSCLLPSAILPDPLQPLQPLQPLSLTGHARPSWIAQASQSASIATASPDGIGTRRLWSW